MKTTIEELDEKMIVTLAGSFDTAAALESEKTLKPVTTSEEANDVVFECQDLEYIASSGLRILLDVLKKTKAKGKKVTLRNVNDDIKNVFKITGFINLFEFE